MKPKGSSLKERVDTAAIAEIAIEAGRAIMAVYDQPFDVRLKPDSSPVTLADLRAEEVILRELRALAPEIPVVAEESVAAGDVPEIMDLFFLVDPLDGTREFVNRNGEFTVNIALIAQGEPVLGVIFAPARGEIAWADARGGAFCAHVREGEIVDAKRLRARPWPQSGATALVSRSHCDARTRAALARAAPEHIEPLGSSLKFCRIAEGLADLYPRHGRTMQWDTAAGDAILRAAGGCVVDFDGAPLRYGRHEGDGAFGNPDFVALGDPEARARI